MKHIKVVAFNCSNVWSKTLETIWNEGDQFEVHYGSECGCLLLRIGEM
jgi:hypothetical protein